MAAHDILVQNAEASSSSAFSVIQDQDVVMQDTNSPHSGLANQDIIMQGPDAPYCTKSTISSADVTCDTVEEMAPE